MAAVQVEVGKGQKTKVLIFCSKNGAAFRGKFLNGQKNWGNVPFFGVF